MEYNFKDYKTYCKIMNIKASDYKSLLEYKQQYEFYRDVFMNM